MNAFGSPGPTNFAGVLSSMAFARETDPAWSDDELVDDVATIRYERALETHPRSQPVDVASGAVEASVATQRRGANHPVPNPKPLKTASLTIRLSAAECAQLRRRADEAGLTVSAYLRSCALEVETLRAQVKDTLAQLRNSRTISAQACERERTWRYRSALRHLRQWLRRLRHGGLSAMGVNPVNPFAPVQK